MKKNQALLEALKESFNEITSLPKSTTPEEARKLSARHMQKAFSAVGVEIKGSENLPSEQGVIFIYNHLHNHPFFTVAEGFQITLDSHFISMILDRYYKNAGTRIVRHSLPEEENHKSYYDTFDYIRVYAKGFLPPQLKKKEIKTVNQQFYFQAVEKLKDNVSLVFSPEGASYYTETSPGSFRNGIFKLAAAMKQQPLIVPIVMVNFDKLPSEAPYKCQIMPPFRMRDFGVFSPESDALKIAVKKINLKYSKWVKDLAKEDANFAREIKVLQQRIRQKKNKNDLTVFYGSSTIRLWKNIHLDFKGRNTLNLGFGGAFIHSLHEYFDVLFGEINPTAVVLYLGGNDLTLGYSAAKIAEEIIAFVKRVHAKFPHAKIYNIAIKPSFEREHELKKIKEINSFLKAKSEEIPYLFQIDFFELLIDDNGIKKEYFLQDGLHLNPKGYQVLKQVITKKLH